MTVSNNPRFRLLVGWCFLMTSALLIITVCLAISQKKSDSNMTGKEELNSTENNTKPGQLIGSPHGPYFNNHIHLISDKEKIWICSDPCKAEIHGGNVTIRTSGLYYIHAQVYFDQKKAEFSDPATVLLLKNEGSGTQARKLSEVSRFEPGSLTMIRLVKLIKGESISLNIDPQSLRLSKEDFHTYWDILLCNKE